MLIFLLISLLLLLFWSYNRFGQDLASPSLFFIGGWCACVFVAYCYSVEWSLETMSFGTFFLILGGAIMSFAGEYFARQRYRYTFHKVIRAQQNFYVIKVWKLIAFAVFQIVVYYLVSKAKMSFSMQSTLAEAIADVDHQTKFEDVIFKLPPYLNIPNQICQIGGYIWCFFAPFYLSKSKEFRKQKIWCTINLIIAIVGSLLSGGRMPIFGYIVPTFTLWFLIAKSNRTISIRAVSRKFIIMAIVIIVGLGTSFTKLGTIIGRDESLEENSKYMFAVYCGAEVKNLDKVISYPISYQNHGYPAEITLSGFYGNLFDRLGVNMPKFIYNSGFQHVNGLMLGNVYSCYKNYFVDFGHAGVFLVFIMVSIYCFLYYKILDTELFKTGRLNLYCCWYIYLSMGIALSFFSELFFIRMTLESFIRYTVYWTMIIWFLQGRRKVIAVENR